MNNNFLLVNYAPGAAGKFLSSVLMASKSVAHFSPAVEQEKTFDSCYQYITQHFVKNLNDWLLHEPKQAVAWNLTFISANYPRGNQLSIEEFEANCKQHGNQHFHNMQLLGKKIIIPWNKVYIPIFFEDSAKVIIILDQDSNDWFDRAHWLKHYQVSNGKIINLTHIKQTNQGMEQYIDLYEKENEVVSEEPVDQYYQKHIINNPNKKLFASVSQFSNRKNNVCTSLSNILSIDNFIILIRQIEQTFNLDKIDEDFIKNSHKHWMSCHDL